MTNKPMLSVERELLELVTDNKHIDKESICIRRWEALCKLRAILNKPAAQHQGEPVACLIRSRNILTQASIAVDGKDHFSAWSEWEPSSIEYGRAVTDPIRNEPVCYEMELLFKEQPAPVAVVMPERADSVAAERGYHKGWNAALDEVARLNGVNK